MTDYSLVKEAEIQARAHVKESTVLLNKLHKIFGSAQQTQEDMLRLSDDAQGIIQKIVEMHNLTESESKLYLQKMSVHLSAAIEAIKTAEESNTAAYHDMQTRGQQQLDALYAQLQTDIKSTNEQFRSELDAIKDETIVKVNDLLTTSESLLQSKIEELVSEGKSLVNSFTQQMHVSVSGLDDMVNYATGVQQTLVGIETDAHGRLSTIKMIQAEAENNAEMARQSALAASQNVGGNSGGGWLNTVENVVDTGIGIVTKILPFFA